MKVRVDPEICAGFGICVGVCPEAFELHDDGYATVLIGDVLPKLQDLVQRAASQCPSGAISLIDGEG